MAKPVNGITEVSKPFIERLRNCQQSTDTEGAHVYADDVLTDLLKQLGYDEVVSEWEAVDKWYA